MEIKPWDESVNPTDLSPYRRNLADTGLNQAKWNRPNTTGPFGQSTTDANGNVTQSFTGGFGQLNDSLMGQAANAAANPMDWGQFGSPGTGEDAGRQASQAAYSQSLSRLNPFWEKSGNKLRTNLFQSGMADADAGDATMGEFGRARNDAYAGAMTGALGAGMQAQQSAFGGNLQSRQNNLANALRGQLRPFEELAGMQRFNIQPQVGRDNSMLVRDSGFNQLAPITAQADHEKQATEEMLRRNPNAFMDDPLNPGSGEQKRKAWESADPRTRDALQAFTWGGTLDINPGYKP
jgi:hypothetical protein